MSSAAAWGSPESTPGTHGPPITTGQHSTLCSPDLCWVGAAPNSQSRAKTNAQLSPAPQEIQWEIKLQEAARVVNPLQMYFPCQGDLGAEKAEGAGGDSEGGSSGLNPRCTQLLRNITVTPTTAHGHSWPFPGSALLPRAEQEQWWQPGQLIALTGHRLGTVPDPSWQTHWCPV